MCRVEVKPFAGGQLVALFNLPFKRTAITSSSRNDLLAGVALDLFIGDPSYLPHPIRGLGFVITRVEQFWRCVGLPLRVSGSLFCASIVTFAYVAVRATMPFLNVYWIFTLLACRSLDDESSHVIEALRQGDVPEARNRLSRIVGRDTANLSEAEILRAVVETLAENVSDGVIAPLLYLLLFGPAGMAAYKAINTLDSMVGYKNARYREFGWASARLDDLANFIPARLTAVLIWMAAALTGGNVRESINMTRRDGNSQPSPNAGYPEAAFAGALQIQLGGLNFYQGVPSRKACMGEPRQPLTIRIASHARRLLYVSTALFVGIAQGFLR